MWPSEDTATRLYSWANIGLIFSLVFGVVSTILVVWMGNVKEAYTQAELSDTRDRLGKAESKAGEATERASKANLKRVELQNRMIDIFGPRQLTPEQSTRIAGKLGGLKGVKIDVFVPALASPYNPTEVSDSLNTGITVVRILRRAHVDAEGWLVESCQSVGASNLVFGILDDDPVQQESIDRKIASRLLDAFAPEIGTWPRIEPSYIRRLACTNFSHIEGAGPNKRQHDATISITIGIKISPLLTREMVEPPDEEKKP